MRALGMLCALVPLTACTLALGIEQPTVNDVDLRITINPAVSQTSTLFAFDITVTNGGSDEVDDARVVVTLPGTSHFGADDAPECGTPSSTSADCSLPVLVGSASHRFTLTALPIAGMIRVSVFSPNDLEPSNNVAMLAMEGGADVEVRPLLDGITPVVGAGQLETYTFRVRNNGPSVAKQVTIDITMSPGFELYGLGGIGWSCGTSTCTLPELLTNAYSLQWTGRTPTTAGDVFIQGTVWSTTADVMPANNTTRYEQRVDDSADLVITLSATPDPVAAGGALTYTLAVRNNGPSAVGNVVVTDTLPPGTTFVSATGTGWSCTLAGAQVTCQRVTYLEVGTAPIYLAVTAPTAPASITNIAAVSAANPDNMPADNTASITTTVQ